MTAITLEAEKKESSGKGAARALRREGRVPGIIYGGSQPETKISLGQKELFHLYNKGHFFSNVLEVKLGSEAIRVLPRDIQMHPVKDIPEHVDFLRLSGDTKVRVMVPVIFHNKEKSPGLKRGGVLNIVRREVELLCVSSKIPGKLDVDLSGASIGDAIHISAIALPEGVTPTITDRDFTIATVVGRIAKEDEGPVGPAVAAEPEEDAAEGSEESSEG